MKKIINVYSNKNDSVIFTAKDYSVAVQNLFGNRWISIKEEIIIENEYTTLEEYFGEDVCDMMVSCWDIDNFNEFWKGDFWMKEVEYFD